MDERRIFLGGLVLSLGLLEEEDDFCCFRSLRLAEEDGGGTVLVGGGAVFDVEDEVLRVGRLLVEDERLDSSCEDSWSGLSLICSACLYPTKKERETTHC